MILFIIGALFVLIALAILIFSDDAKRTAIIPAVVAVIFIGISCVSYVPTGYTGPLSQPLAKSRMARRTQVWCQGPVAVHREDG